MSKKKVKLGSPLFTHPFYIECNVAANQAFVRRSGQFVTIVSGDVTIAPTNASELWGWALVGKNWTSSATAGADHVTVCTDPYRVWEVPAGTTFAAAALEGYIGDHCDITFSTIQYADNAADNEEVIVIVGGSVDEQTLYVHMNPLKMYTVGVTD